jgi:hypothetical protein
MKDTAKLEYNTVKIPSLRQYYQQMLVFNEQQLDKVKRTPEWLPCVSGGPDTAKSTKRSTR